jgi:hypothetical protein
MLLHADQFGSRLGAALFFLVLVCFYLFRGHTSGTRPILQSSLQTTTSTGNASVAKISVIYGELNENYIHAVESHENHAARHGYPQWILRNQLVDGYWNKILYILQIPTQELGKNVADRMEWIMYAPGTPQLWTSIN